MARKLLDRLARLPATFELQSPVDVRDPDASLAPEAPRDFEMEAYTGAVFDVGFGPAVIVLEGLDVPADGVPAFRQHKPELFVGRSTDVENTGAVLNVRGTLFSGVAEAEEVARISDQGGRWQASVGIRIDFAELEFIESGQFAQVNGRELAGPFVMLKATTLREVSFVPLGADGATSAVALDDELDAEQPDTKTAKEAQNMEAEKERIAALSAEFADRPAFALKAIGKGWTLADAKERAAELDAALAERDTAHAAELAAKEEAHAAALEAAKVPPPAKPSPAAILSGFDSSGAELDVDVDGDPEGAFDALVNKEEARLETRGGNGAARGGSLRFAKTARGRFANLRAQAVANVAEKHPDIHRAYLTAHNAAASKRRGR
jgi:hypothetical protein